MPFSVQNMVDYFDNSFAAHNDWRAVMPPERRADVVIHAPQPVCENNCFYFPRLAALLRCCAAARRRGGRRGAHSR